MFDNSATCHMCVSVQFAWIVVEQVLTYWGLSRPAKPGGYSIFETTTQRLIQLDFAVKFLHVGDDVLLLASKVHTLSIQHG